jgi:hypothetical protein
LKGRESLPIRSEIRASSADRIEALRFSGKPRQQRKAPVPSMAGANSIVIQAERERNGLCRFFHFSSRQTRDASADIAFGNSLEIVKVGSTGVRKPIVLGQHHFSGDAAYRRCDGSAMKFADFLALRPKVGDLSLAMERSAREPAAVASVQPTCRAASSRSCARREDGDDACAGAPARWAGVMLVCGGSAYQTILPQGWQQTVHVYLALW